MGSKSEPPPPDFNAVQDKENAANRPNQNTPWASTNWQQGADGQWTQNTNFAGPWAGLAGGLQGQAAMSMGQPMDWGQFGQAGTGDQARDQAINAAYGQATSRLDPQWQQREAAQRTQLLNQGLTPGTEAYNNAMGQLGQQRNDAYTSAMASAIGQGTAAGHTAFADNQMARQQAIADALRQRGQPMAELGQLQGFLAQPGFNQANYMPGAMANYQGQMDAYNNNQGRWVDYLQGGAQLAGSLAPLFALSDERAKMNVQRLGLEAMPGVPWATWEWKDAPGTRWAGVIAQDLAKVAPQYLRMRPDGLMEVDYSFLLVTHGS